MNARKTLVELYLDYVNNYLTVSKFAEHHGLTEEDASALLKLAAKVALGQHPES